MLGNGQGTDLKVVCAKVLPQPPGKEVVVRNEFLFARGSGTPLLIIERPNCTTSPAQLAKISLKGKAPFCEGFYWVAAKVHRVGGGIHTPRSKADREMDE